MLCTGINVLTCSGKVQPGKSYAYSISVMSLHTAEFSVYMIPFIVKL